MSINTFEEDFDPNKVFYTREMQEITKIIDDLLRDKYELSQTIATLEKEKQERQQRSDDMSMYSLEAAEERIAEMESSKAKIEGTDRDYEAIVSEDHEEMMRVIHRQMAILKPRSSSHDPVRELPIIKETPDIDEHVLKSVTKFLNLLGLSRSKTIEPKFNTKWQASNRIESKGIEHIEGDFYHRFNMLNEPCMIKILKYSGGLQVVVNAKGKEASNTNRDFAISIRNINAILGRDFEDHIEEVQYVLKTNPKDMSVRNQVRVIYRTSRLITVDKEVEVKNSRIMFTYNGDSGTYDFMELDRNPEDVAKAYHLILRGVREFGLSFFRAHGTESLTRGDGVQALLLEAAKLSHGSHVMFLMTMLGDIVLSTQRGINKRRKRQ